MTIVLLGIVVFDPKTELEPTHKLVPLPLRAGGTSFWVGVFGRVLVMKVVLLSFLAGHDRFLGSERSLQAQKPLEKVGGKAPTFSNVVCGRRGRLDTTNERFLGRKLHCLI